VATPGRVLIVDSSDDSRAVLREALSRNGTEIFEASRSDTGLALARSCRPDVIVVDVDENSQPHPQVSRDFDQATHDGSASVLLLATARRNVEPLAAGEVVAKPYHYAPLIRKIEELLARAA